MGFPSSLFFSRVFLFSGAHHSDPDQPEIWLFTAACSGFCID